MAGDDDTLDEESCEESNTQRGDDGAPPGNHIEVQHYKGQRERDILKSILPISRQKKSHGRENRCLAQEILTGSLTPWAIMDDGEHVDEKGEAVDEGESLETGFQGLLLLQDEVVEEEVDDAGHDAGENRRNEP